MLQLTKDSILSFFPGSARAVAEKSGRRLNKVYANLSSMKRLGIVHISGYDLEFGLMPASKEQHEQYR